MRIPNQSAGAMAAIIMSLTFAVPSNAGPITGSGDIQFTFTSFNGAFADGFTPGYDPSNAFLIGSVNGVTPTYNGVSVPADFITYYYGGTAPLSGQSVSMIYQNSPGAIGSVISFTPEAHFTDISLGQPFKIGTISFTNGQWVGGASNHANNFPVLLNFTLSTTSATAAFNQTVNDAITVVTNQSSGDCSTLAGQQDEADFVYINSATGLGSLRVYDFLCKPAGETNVGTIELWTKFGSLDYVDLRNPGGSGFFVSSTGVGPIPSGPVPEPITLSLFGAGLAGVAGFKARRRRKKST